MGIKHIHGTTTSLNGCKVDIDGRRPILHYTFTYYRFSRVPVHLSGEKDVPKWRLVFRN